MATLIDVLHKKYAAHLEKPVFDAVISLFVFINPLVIVHQSYLAWTESNIDGLSVPLWFGFAAFQLGVTLEGIKSKSAKTFWSLGLSFIGSLTILAAIFVR